jgi:polyisoprenoid-binding protein YceI
MMKKVIPPMLLAFLFFLPIGTEAATWKIDSAHSNAQFSVRHMMVSTVRGEFTRVSGAVEMNEADLTKSSVVATIEAGSIQTREPARDKHLKSADFFDVEKFPTIEFRSKNVTKTSDGHFKIAGDLTLHGVTKEVVLDADPLSPIIKDPQGAARTGTSATTKINRKDFGLTWNRALETGGVVVSDEVNITIDVELIKSASTND